MEVPDLMTLEEVAKVLHGASVRWIKEQLIKPRRLECVKLGHGKYYVTPRALNDYLQQKTIKTHVKARAGLR